LQDTGKKLRQNATDGADFVRDQTKAAAIASKQKPQRLSYKSHQQSQTEIGAAHPNYQQPPVRMEGCAKILSVTANLSDLLLLTILSGLLPGHAGSALRC
jgi:hypothetical protein